MILINTFFLSLVYYNMPLRLQNALYFGNLIFTCFFALEMVVKMLGLGVKNYVMDKFNDFDAIVVIIGLLEFVGVSSKAITVLRTFRLLRIFKIVRSWKNLKQLLQVVLSSLSSLANLGFLMALFCFIYGLMAFQFFYGPMPEYMGETPRYSYEDFGQSMISIWILLTGENCNNFIYSGIA